MSKLRKMLRCLFEKNENAGKIYGFINRCKLFKDWQRQIPDYERIINQSLIYKLSIDELDRHESLGMIVRAKTVRKESRDKKFRYLFLGKSHTEKVALALKKN